MARNTKRRPQYSKRRRNRNSSSPSPMPKPLPLQTCLCPRLSPSPFTLTKGSAPKRPSREQRKKTHQERIKAFFRRETNKDYKELIINTEALERRVAMMENGILQGFDAERLDRPNGQGNIQRQSSKSRSRTQSRLCRHWAGEECLPSLLGYAARCQ